MSKVEEIKAKIKERGYWEIAFKPNPTQYQEKKFTHEQLRQWLEKYQVQYRGWYYPHFSDRTDFGDYYNVQGYVESYVHWGSSIEIFRFYQSGQFVHYMGMQEDRLDDHPPFFEQWRSDMQKPPPEQLFLEPTMTLYQLTEIFLFASDLASEGVFGDQVQISIKLHNMNHRFLKSLDRLRAPFHSRECHTEMIEIGPITMTPEELKLDHDKLAIDKTIEILALFDFKSEHIRKVLERDQENFYKRSF